MLLFCLKPSSGDQRFTPRVKVASFLADQRFQEWLAMLTQAKDGHRA
jgi:hypothetical protein